VLDYQNDLGLDFQIHFSPDFWTDSLTQEYQSDSDSGQDCQICHVLQGYQTYYVQDWDCAQGCQIYRVLG